MRVDFEGVELKKSSIEPPFTCLVSTVVKSGCLAEGSENVSTKNAIGMRITTTRIITTRKAMKSDWAFNLDTLQIIVALRPGVHYSDD